MNEPTVDTPPPDDNFEGVPCDKCGGTGRYEGYGPCFACDETGLALTKRGRAALVYYFGLVSKRTDLFRIGDLLFYNHKFYPVNDIRPATPDGEWLVFATALGELTLWRRGRCRFGCSSAFKAEAMSQAMEYQAILDKNGKDTRPR